MPRKSTTDLVKSLTDFYQDATDSLLLAQKPAPRWIAPDLLQRGVFEKIAEAYYKRELSKKKFDQDAEVLINDGNSYYFAMMVKKAHRVYTRSRIESVAVAKSVERGLADKVGFLTAKYQFLGDKADPND